MSDAEVPELEEQDSKDEDYQDEEMKQDELVDAEGEDDDAEDDDEEEEDEEEEEEEDDDDEAKPEEEEVPEEQPVKRKRGRPPGSGKKKASKATRFQTLQVPTDANGQPFAVDGDELQLPEDPAGEEKIDKLGFLQGGRDFRLRTFNILGKGQRQYMLATEPARCIGFRDSYLLFQRHRKLLKVRLSDDEKFDLIERELIPRSYKGRTLGVVTARSIFREFGARVIVGGHRVTDDYYEAEARSEGHSPDELADSEDFVPAEGIPYDKNQYCAWYNAPQHIDSAAIFESNLKSVLKQQTGAPPHAGSPGAPGDTTPDPQLVRASSRSAVRFNSHINAGRKGAMARSVYTLTPAGTEGGLVDPYTGVHFVSSITQPQRARVARVSKRAPRGAVMFTTVMNPRTPHTNLASVDPSVYADADDATKEAIRRQIDAEKAF